MAREKKLKVGTLNAEAALLEEAADTKLRAAEKMSRADALLGEDDEAPAPTARFNDDSFAQAPIPLSRIEQVLEEMKGQGKFQVFKLVGSVKSKVGVFPIEEYPDRMENIAAENGGGTYRVVFNDERGQYLGSDTQTYDPKSYGLSASAQVKGDNGTIDKLMERMDRREEASSRQMEIMRQENMKLLLAIVEKSNAAPQRSTSELVELMKFMRESSPEPRSPLDNLKEVLELASAVREETGAVEPEHPLVASIDKVFKLISPLLGAWATKVASAPQAPASLPAKALTAPQAQTPPVPGGQVVHAPIPTAAPAPTAQAPEVVNDPRMVTYAQSLLSQVTAGMEAESVGEAILNLTPEDNLGELDEMVKNPAFVALLIHAEPKLIPHQKWLAELSVYISNQLTEEPTPADAPALTPEPAVGAPA